MLFHIKPAFQAQVEKQCAKLEGVNLSVLKLNEGVLRLVGLKKARVDFLGGC
jgi:hypothetical protein